MVMCWTYLIFLLELQVEVQLSEEDYQDGGTIGIRTKKQMVTGPHKGRCQRLERKAWIYMYLLFEVSLAASLSPYTDFIDHDKTYWQYCMKVL